jgi:hypothetical protein
MVHKDVSKSCVKGKDEKNIITLISNDESVKQQE